MYMSTESLCFFFFMRAARRSPICTSDSHHLQLASCEKASESGVPFQVLLSRNLPLLHSTPQLSTKAQVSA
jgi:hypothetical protein